MPSTAPAVERFSIHVDEALIEELSQRLGRVRWPGEVATEGWERGVSLDSLQELVEHWVTRYDWRRYEAAINRLDHFRTNLDGVSIHFVHQRGKGPSPLPLLISHGWPGSFYEFSRLIPLLVDPARHGGRAEDAFDVVLPSLPGFTFSERLQPPATFNVVPSMWQRLMADVLGYNRFGAHGDDIGAMVTNRLALEVPASLIGLHVTFPPEPAFGEGKPPPSVEEQAILEGRTADFYWDSGYLHFGATRPQTLAYALADSPSAWQPS